MSEDAGLFKGPILKGFVKRRRLPPYEEMSKKDLLREIQREQIEWGVEGEETLDAVIERESQQTSLTSKKGVFCCRRTPLPDKQLVEGGRLTLEAELGADGTVVGVRIVGMAHCGTYACPVCSGRKVAKSEYVPRTVNALKKVIQAGGMIVFATMTVRHKKEDRLEDLKAVLSRARKEMFNTKYNNFGSVCPVERWSTVSSFENNYGRNGHHPHLHVAIPLKEPLEDYWDSSKRTERGYELVRQFRKAEKADWRGWGKDSRRTRGRLLKAYEELKSEGWTNPWWDFVVNFNRKWKELVGKGSKAYEPELLIGADLQRITKADINDAAGYLYKDEKDIHGVACEVSLGGVTKESRNGSNVSMWRLAYDSLTHHDPKERWSKAKAYREWEQVWSKPGMKLALGLAQLEKQLAGIELEEDEEDQVEPEPMVIEVGTIEKDIFTEGNADELSLTLLLEEKTIKDYYRVGKWLAWIQELLVKKAAMKASRANLGVSSLHVRVEWLIAGLESDRSPPPNFCIRWVSP